MGDIRYMRSLYPETKHIDEKEIMKPIVEEDVGYVFID